MILFVDDEMREVRDYVNELEISGYPVVFMDDASEALEFFYNKSRKVSLLILDLMMPPGSNFEGMDTELGLRTGVCFFKKIREKAPDLYVFVLTNVSDDDVAKHFHSERKCQLLRKEDFLPLQLVEKVKEVLPEIVTRG
jgi:CheY-like chemotaxis protein